MTIAPYISETNIANLTTDEAKVDSFILWTEAKTVNVTGEHLLSRLWPSG